MCVALKKHFVRDILDQVFKDFGWRILSCYVQDRVAIARITLSIFCILLEQHLNSVKRRFIANTRKHEGSIAKHFRDKRTWAFTWHFLDCSIKIGRVHTRLLAKMLYHSILSVICGCVQSAAFKAILATAWNTKPSSFFDVTFVFLKQAHHRHATWRGGQNNIGGGLIVCSPFLVSHENGNCHSRGMTRNTLLD